MSRQVVEARTIYDLMNRVPFQGSENRNLGPLVAFFMQSFLQGDRNRPSHVLLSNDVYPPQLPSGIKEQVSTLAYAGLYSENRPVLRMVPDNKPRIRNLPPTQNNRFFSASDLDNLDNGSDQKRHVLHNKPLRPSAFTWIQSHAHLEAPVWNLGDNIRLQLQVIDIENSPPPVGQPRRLDKRAVAQQLQLHPRDFVIDLVESQEQSIHVGAVSIVPILAPRPEFDSVSARQVAPALFRMLGVAPLSTDSAYLMDPLLIRINSEELGHRDKLQGESFAETFNQIAAIHVRSALIALTEIRVQEHLAEVLRSASSVSSRMRVEADKPHVQVLRGAAEGMLTLIDAMLVQVATSAVRKNTLLTPEEIATVAAATESFFDGVTAKGTFLSRNGRLKDIISRL